MKTILIPFCVFLLITSVSCRRTETVTCNTGSFSFIGVGFADSDLIGATIRQYQSGAVLGKLLQTSSLTYGPWQRDMITTDSGYFSPGTVAAAHTPLEVGTTYGYVISLPADGISDTISNVMLLGNTQETVSGPPFICNNPVISYTYNGQSVTNAPNQLDIVIYLVK